MEPYLPEPKWADAWHQFPFQVRGLTGEMPAYAMRRLDPGNGCKARAVTFEVALSVVFRYHNTHQPQLRCAIWEGSISTPIDLSRVPVPMSPQEIGDWVTSQEPWPSCFPSDPTREDLDQPAQTMSPQRSIGIVDTAIRRYVVWPVSGRAGIVAFLKAWAKSPDWIEPSIVWSDEFPTVIASDTDLDAVFVAADGELIDQLADHGFTPVSGTDTFEELLPF